MTRDNANRLIGTLKNPNTALKGPGASPWRDRKHVAFLNEENSILMELWLRDDWKAIDSASCVAGRDGDAVVLGIDGPGGPATILIPFSSIHLLIAHAVSDAPGSGEGTPGL